MACVRRERDDRTLRHKLAGARADPVARAAEGDAQEQQAIRRALAGAAILRGVTLMTTRQAIAIFRDIKNPYRADISDKALAIYHVCHMPTHNSITKDEILDVLWWLWDQHFEMNDAQDVFEYAED